MKESRTLSLKVLNDEGKHVPWFERSFTHTNGLRSKRVVPDLKGREPARSPSNGRSASSD
ncbi:MAG: hypothetical protein SA339_06660 [Methanomassiliicoccus sp.]|nr:hypothetical protein [Methanomassiliicoccus sp.]